MLFSFKDKLYYKLNVELKQIKLTIKQIKLTQRHDDYDNVVGRAKELLNK